LIETIGKSSLSATGSGASIFGITVGAAHLYGPIALMHMSIAPVHGRLAPVHVRLAPVHGQIAPERARPQARPRRD
jgi:hypothetical protein